MKRVIGTICIALILLLASGCKQTASGESSQKKGEKIQENAMQRAQQAVRVPRVNHFLTREAVAKWMERMDVPDKTFYIYILGDNGNVIGYYVGQTRPISVCSFLTPSERVQTYDGGDYGARNPVTVQSPALDGVYYGGGCDTKFFFDAQTDALIEIGGGQKYFLADQPLSLEAEPISIQAAK